MGLVYIYSNMGNKLRAAMGTPGYMAPEVVSKTTQSLEPTASYIFDKCLIILYFVAICAIFFDTLDTLSFFYTFYP